MPITVLSQETINQIAAGEVIERPSSVVKELMENAIDAGATAVTIEIRDGGMSLIRITDNGCGIPKEEIPLAFLRHATSKISRVEDLLTVSSLGFRGEALSSIAAVAQVELITRTEHSLTGARYCIEGGEEKSLQEIGAPAGTTFLVRNLFYNTPARRKFLKSPNTEGNYIIALVERMALSHPEVSVRLLVNGQNRLHTAGNHKLKDIIYTVYGRELTKELLPVQADFPQIHLEGYVGKPLVSRGNRTYENYYINGRYIKSGLITKAIEAAYHGFVMQHKYPFTVLHLSVNPELLDVNVHPTKMELRFREEDAIYQAVYDSLRAAITGEELIPRVTPGKDEPEKATEEKKGKETGHGPEPFETKREKALMKSAEPKPSEPGPSIFGGEDFRQMKEKTSPESRNSSVKMSAGISAATVREHPVYERELTTYEEILQKLKNEDSGLERKPSVVESGAKTPEKGIHAETHGSENASNAAFREEDILPKKPDVSEKPVQLDLFEEKILTKQARQEFVLLGQLFDTYWLVQYQDKFLMIDQHAALEKVLFERTMKTLETKEYTTQQVNPPLILTLNGREAQVLTEQMPLFEKLGFEIEPFGGKEYAVYGVPDNLFSIAKQELLMEMIDSLADDNGRASRQILEERVAMMSCKAAVKGNNRLSSAEAESLIDELLQLDNPYTCPHGRPTIIAMTKYELEKKFKRVVS